MIGMTLEIGPEAGTEIGPCVVINRTGSGGMAVVYTAYYEKTGEIVAVKTPHSASLVNNTDCVEAFMLEAAILSELQNNPYTISIYEYGLQDSVPYIVMPLMLSNLRSYMTVFQPDIATTLRTLSRLALAIDALHRIGYVHCDLKPENVLVNTDEEFFLTDFGVALNVHVNRQTDYFQMRGTPAYLAPEVISGAGSNQYSDVYSFAVMVFEILAGFHPFENINTLIGRGTGTIKLPELSQAKFANRTECINHILQKATSFSPAHRYSAASAMVSDLKACFAG